MVMPATGCSQGASSGCSNSRCGLGMAYSHACRRKVHLFNMHTSVMGAPSATMAAGESCLQQCQVTAAHGVPHKSKCMRRCTSASEKSGRYRALRCTTAHASRLSRHRCAHTPSLAGIHRFLVL